LISRDGVSTDLLKGKTILITGASGLIGTQFLSSLCFPKIKDLDIFVCVKNTIPEHLSWFYNHGINFIKADLSEPKSMNWFPYADIIIHAATYGQPGAFLQDKMATIKLNTSALFGLLDRLNDGGKLLFISSSEIYSSSRLDHPRASYIEAKRCGEVICMSSDKDCKIARVCLAYGVGNKVGDKRVMYEFISQALTDKQIKLLDGGSASRTYCYVANAVNMMWNILLKGEKTTYDVGGESSVKIYQLANMIAEMTGASVEIPVDDGNRIDGSPDRVHFNMDKYNNEFGKQNYLSLEEGLRRTINWQKLLSYGHC